MRAFLIICLLAPIMAFEVEIKHVGPASPIDVMQERIMEKEITAILECIRDILQNGDPETGLPPLDPLVVPNIDLDLGALGINGISGHASLKGLTSAGHSGWDMKKLKISLVILPPGAKAKVEVIWPMQLTSGDHDTDVTIFGYTIKSSGKVDGIFEKLRLTLDAQVKITPVQIKTAKIGLSLASSALELGTLTIDDVDIAGPISKLVSELPACFVQFQDEFNNLLKDVIIPLINKILSGKVAIGSKKIPIIGKCLP